jgi:hypothetical protein
LSAGAAQSSGREAASLIAVGLSFEAVAERLFGAVALLTAVLGCVRHVIGGARAELLLPVPRLDS